MVNMTKILPDPDAQRSTSLLPCLAIAARRHEMNLTVTQLIQDNFLPDANVTSKDLVLCAIQSGLKAKIVNLGWRDLVHLQKALPVIVRLKNGDAMVLIAVNGDEKIPSVALQDPAMDDGLLINLDQSRFEQAWTGETILLRRDYSITNEEKPFGIGLITSLVFRERKMLRDLVLCALALSIFGLAPIIFYRLMTDKVLNYKALNTYTVLCIGMLTLIVFEAVFTYLRQYMVLVISARVDARMSEYLFDRLLRLPTDFFERTQVGRIAHDMREADKIRTFLVQQAFGTVLDSLTLFVFLPVMFAFNPLLTFIVLGFCALIVVFLILMLPTVRSASGAVIEAEVQRGSFLYQNLAGIRTVKSLALEERQRRLWGVHVMRSSRAQLYLGFVTGFLMACVLPLERFAVSGALAVGVYLAVSGNDPVAVGALFMFVMLSQRIASPLVQMARLVGQYDEAAIAIKAVSALVNQTKEEGISAHGVRIPLKGHIEFSKLRFKYQGATGFALDEISFDVPIGTTLGIVGRSGSGKTTVTRLLQRLHAEYEGLIKIDGIDIREYDVAHLRRSLGVVLQENFLFSGTIRENITAAKPHATYDEMVRAARLAGAEEFIDRLARGYETHIFEGSPNLSGGQRQRLAIARALIVDPRILILDEATSALDPDSEAIVNDNIRRIAQGRTVIVISHRLSSLVNSDAILVLERGKFEDVGKHEELLERCEIYSGLWAQQNRHIAAQARLAIAARGPIRVS